MPNDFEASAKCCKEHFEQIARMRAVSSTQLDSSIARLREIAGDPPRERADFSLEASIGRDEARLKEVLRAQCVTGPTEAKKRGGLD